MKSQIFGSDLKKTVNYEEPGVVRNGKLTGGVGGGKKEKMKIKFISLGEKGNPGYGFI